MAGEGGGGAEPGVGGLVRDGDDGEDEDGEDEEREAEVADQLDQGLADRVRGIEEDGGAAAGGGCRRWELHRR